MRLVRRLARHLALPLALLLPGLGGSALQVAHPCPVQDWAVMGGHGAHAAPADAHHGHEAPAPESPAGHAESCHCIGACGQGTAPGVPAAQVAVVAAERVVLPARPVARVWLPVSTPSDYLPLSTAPPSA